MKEIFLKKGLSEDTNITGVDMSLRNIHFSILYASPLVWEKERQLLSYNLLNIPKEIEEIEWRMKEMPKQVLYTKDLATKNNFMHAFSMLPVVVHFTGHGEKNNEDFFGWGFYPYKERGSNMLILESDTDGMCNYFFLNELREFLKEVKKVPELVYVSSCFSEPIGEVFKQAKVRHVICIDKKHAIGDHTSIYLA